MHSPLTGRVQSSRRHLRLRNRVAITNSHYPFCTQPRFVLFERFSSEDMSIANFPVAMVNTKSSVIGLFGSVLTSAQFAISFIQPITSSRVSNVKPMQFTSQRINLSTDWRCVDTDVYRSLESTTYQRRTLT